MYSSGNNSNRHGQRPISSDVKASTGQVELTMNIPSWDLHDPFKCSYYNCDRVYWDETILKRHQAYDHPVPLQCPFGLGCQQSTRKYFGLWNLRRHVNLKHAPLFSEPTCFDSECKYNKTFRTWNHVLKHLVTYHLDAIGCIIKSTTSSIETKNKI